MDNSEKSPDDFARIVEEHRKDPSKRATEGAIDFASRPLGLVALIVCGLLVWQTYRSIHDAQIHAAVVTFSGRNTFIQPFFLVLGVIYIAFGQSASKFMGPTTKPSWKAILIVVACAAAGWYYSDYVKGLIASFGYQV